MESDIIVYRSGDEWYKWELWVGEEIVARGFAETAHDADAAAVKARRAWEDRGRP